MTKSEKKEIVVNAILAVAKRHRTEVEAEIRKAVSNELTEGQLNIREILFKFIKDELPTINCPSTASVRITVED